jgi:hypothetical protein
MEMLTLISTAGKRYRSALLKLGFDALGSVHTGWAVTVPEMCRTILASTQFWRFLQRLMDAFLFFNKSEGIEVLPRSRKASSRLT